MATGTRRQRLIHGGAGGDAPRCDADTPRRAEGCRPLRACARRMAARRAAPPRARLALPQPGGAGGGQRVTGLAQQRRKRPSLRCGHPSSSRGVSSATSMRKGRGRAGNPRLQAHASTACFPAVLAGRFAPAIICTIISQPRRTPGPYRAAPLRQRGPCLVRLRSACPCPDRQTRLCRPLHCSLVRFAASPLRCRAISGSRRGDFS